ncbi:MAG: CsbD family protein [Phycisphaerae bacterium]
MNEQILKGNWNELKGYAHERWSKLTESDMDQIQGSKEKLVGRVQQVYGESRESAMEQVNRWLESMQEWADKHNE